MRRTIEVKLEKEYNFPKVELHCHLEGIARIETVFEIASGKIKRANAVFDDFSSSVQQEKDREWKTFEEFRSLCCIADDTCDAHLPEFLDRFRHFMGYIQGDKHAINRIVLEALEDCAQNNVKYIELRFSPFLLASADIEPHQESFGDLSPSGVMEVVHSAMQLGERLYGVKSRLILCNVIGLPKYALRVAELCTKYSSFVVGIDIAGIENGHVYETEDEKLQVQAMNYAIEHGINRTVHAGERGGPQSVRNALKLFNPSRIGHGYHIVDDTELYEEMRKGAIHIETCPCSCVKIGGFWNDNFQRHPIKRFVEDGFNVSVSTDDPGVFRNSLTDNYRFCAKKFNISSKQLMETNLNAARACFLPDDEKEELIQFLEHAYSKIQIESF